jgi:hypothetical protein
MSSFQEIEHSEAEAMQIAFIQDMNGLETLTNVFPMAFSSNAGTIFGYSMPAEEYASLMTGTEGVAYWKIKFGYTQEEENAPLKIILYGTDEGGNLLTPYYKMTGGYYEPKNLGCDIPNSIISHDEGCDWLGRYITQAENETIAKRVFTTPNDELLRGYTFDAADFILPVIELGEISEFFIAFTIHHNPLLPSSEGHFGLLICARGAGSELQYSHFYDMGSPCPPDC